MPLDTVSCFIIEPSNSETEITEPKVLPQGEVGELAVGGYQLATGYLNRPEQTNSVFIHSIYGPLYRTGDKARLRTDGTLECLGRLSDGQVKLRGQRLELGEVEQAVLLTSGCHSSVAAVINSILVAFCAVDTGVSEEDILERCRDWLPLYMIPSEIMLMEEFPRLPSGKVDRKKLKADYEKQGVNDVHEPVEATPADELETKILCIVSGILNAEVSKLTNLTSAGLDSLKAIKLASELRESGYDLSSTGILAMRTVSEIIIAVRKIPRATHSYVTPTSTSLRGRLEHLLVQNPNLVPFCELIDDITPCVPLQSAMLAETMQATGAYCNELMLEAPSTCTATCIADAFRQLADCNEFLRSGFATLSQKFVTLSFTALRPGQIAVVEEFQPSFQLSNPEGLLSPMRVQIRETPDKTGARILFQLHHALYDGWSMDILLTDLSAILGGTSTTADARTPFRNVVEWFQSGLSKPFDAQAKAFWAEHLLGWNNIPIPKLCSRKLTTSQVQSKQSCLRIEKRKLELESRKLGCSSQALFQAALVLIWSGILGSQDVVIGSVTSGRTIPIKGIEDTVGPCIASLPVRTRLESLRKISDLMHSIHSSNRYIMQHCTLPLSELRKLTELQPGERFYDVLFVYQESLHSQARQQNLVKELGHLDRLETPLLVEVEPVGDVFKLTITYHQDHFSPEMVDYLVEQFDAISNYLLENINQDIASMRKFPQASLSIYNSPPSKWQGSADLGRAFEKVAAEKPNSTALCFAHSLGQGEGSKTFMSYEQLNATGNRIARYLLSNGVRIGQVVAIIMDKSPSMYASILGILKAGCAYLPLLPSTPPARIKEVLGQAAVETCLIDATLSCDVAIQHVSFVNIDLESLEDVSKDNLQVPLDITRLAYIIYTSGTTGVPKGVAISQENIMSNISHLIPTYASPVQGEPRLLQSCSQAFDVSVFEIFFTWLAGMCLCAGTHDTIFEDLEHTIRELKITHLSMTPTVASLVDPINTPKVSFIVTAGEPLPQSVSEKWLGKLWQGYGPSETTNICTVKHMAPDDYVQHLGHTFPNTSCAVLFPDSLDIVPIGWAGELCFGGQQVAPGYLNSPILTNEKFIAHPQHGRLYRSGDYGRMLPDGSLMILGRMDSQLKLRGQRIDTGELNAIATSTSLATSATSLLVHHHTTSSDQLALIYVPPKVDGDFRVLEVSLEHNKALFAILASRLPAYMIPSYLVPVSTVPLTSSGKIDHGRLRKLFESLSIGYLETTMIQSGHEDKDSDWDTVEVSIAETLSRAIGASRAEIGRWTPLAILGVDSISAISIARDLSSNLKTRVAVSAILQHPTIAQLGQFLRGSSQKVEVSENTQFFTNEFLDEVGDDFRNHNLAFSHVLPCTPLQEAMLANGQKGYYNRALLRLHTQPESLRTYWEIMIQRHDILRTCFILTNNSQRPIAQVVLSRFEIPWKTIVVKDKSLEEAISEHLNSLPDPIGSRVPPISFALLYQADSLFLSIICHHALYDGVAMATLYKEVEALATDHQLLPPVSYNQFLQKALKLPDDVETYWADHLLEYNPTNSLERSEMSGSSQKVYSTCIDLSFKEVSDGVRRAGISVLSLCQATWATVVSIVQKRPDICFGNVVSGRTLDIEALDRLVAPCFNTIPFRTDISRYATNADLIKHFQILNTQHMPYQFTPLRLIQRVALQNSVHLGERLFESLLLLQQPAQELDGTTWILEEDCGDMDVPLVCEIMPCPDSNIVTINIHYYTSLISQEVATALADSFQSLFRFMLYSPHGSITTTSTLSTELQMSLRKMQPKQKHTTKLLSNFDGTDWTPLELQVRQVLSVLSGVSETNIRHSTTIFQLGLDSINAVQVASSLRQLGHSVTVMDVIEAVTCAKIARKAQENKSDGGQEKQASYDFEKFSQEVLQQIDTSIQCENPIEAVIPCTQLQSGMLNSFIQSDGDHYLNAIAYSIDPEVGVDELIDAWNSLQRRHPMLRTGFVPVKYHDITFAMVRYQAHSVNIPLHLPNGFYGWGRDLSRMKKQIGQRLKNSLHLPPIQVIMSLVDGNIVMHVLIHHALYDAQSLHSIMDDLACSLRGKSTKVYPDVEPALSTILMSSSSGTIAAKEFWESKAAEAVVNKFPIMTPLRVESRSVLSETILSDLSFQELQQAAKNSNASVQAIIQAAWARVLSSYLGESSVVFGITLSGRTTDETKDAPFPCLNTIPVVISNQSSNIDLLRSVMELNQQLHRHQFAPLSQVQNWLGHPAGGLFDTLVIYQKLERNEAMKAPWKIVREEAVVEYPVSLEIEPTEGDEIRLCVTYFNDILPQQQANLLIKQFDFTLQDIALNPQGHEDLHSTEVPNLLSILPPVSPILEAPVTLLHEFVEKGARDHPNKAALSFVSGFDGEIPIKQTWSYHEFNCMGNKVARLLKTRVSAGDIIAIHFNKCPEAYFSILGILKIGCSFVALDTSAPQARKQFILNDSKSPCLLSAAESGVDFAISIPIVTIAEENLQKFSGDDIREGPLQSPGPDDTCYCLYTSGTTGTPKGCEITHENVVQAMMAFQQLFGGHWDENSRCLQFAALHFDVSVLEQYWSWSVGIEVVAATKELILDDLTATINRLDITHIDLTPSLARLIHPDEVPSLCRGVFITGGEQLKQEILDTWGPKAVIYNAYGPTEATIGVTMYQRVPTTGRPSNIGKQFSNVGSYIFRPGSEIPVLRGAVGELCVSGKLVGKGYLNRPELTTERFPTLERFGERVYRTGDLVRLLHDGCFDFLGRADDQVKLRGQRLEIAEINHAIRNGVTELHDVATIVARHGLSDKDVLVSFIVPKLSKAGDIRILQDHGDFATKASEACRAKLPGYMIPTYFAVLPRIPLSPNNKAEAKELKRLFAALSHEQLMELSAVKRRPISRAASGTIEKILEGVSSFCGLTVQELNPSTSIFDVGIDSITALRLSSHLKKRGLTSVSPTVLIQNPIIVDLANTLAGKTSNTNARLAGQCKQTIRAYGHKHRAVACRELGIQPSDIEYIAPCTSLQQGIISRSMTTETEEAYFNSFEMILDDNLSIEKLKEAWNKLMRSEAILRTAFVPTTEGFVQVALKERSLPWENYYVTESRSKEQVIERSRREWVHENSTIITKPLSLTYLEVAGSRRLIIHIFHAIYDGNSFELMLNRVRLIYEGGHHQKGPSFIEALAHGPLWKFDYCRDFWREHLREWRYKPIPHGKDQYHNQSSCVVRTIPARTLKQVRSKQNVTEQAIALALWTSVLHQNISKHATVGVVTSGRYIDLENVEETIGPLFNTVPFFCKASKAQSWASLIRRCHDFHTELLGFQHVSLKDIQKWCSKGKPLFDNLFTFQIEDTASNDTKVWEMKESQAEPDYPLAIEVVQTHDDQLRLTLVAQPQVFSSTKLEELLDEIEQAAFHMTTDPDSVIKYVDSNTDNDNDNDEVQMNGISASLEQENNFEWTETPLAMREEIASLINTSLGAITETVSILELGLDSIDLIKLSAKLRNRGIGISPSQIMRLQTIENITQGQGRTQRSETSSNSEEDTLESLIRKLWEYLERSELDLDNIETVLPPTPLQESMVAGMVQSEFETYFNHDVLEIAEGVDIGRLQEAWIEVINQNPILRTGFAVVDDKELDVTYCQVISRPREQSIPKVQLQTMDELQTMLDEAQRVAIQGSALSNLLQIRFVTVGSQNLVVLSIAHALYDGWSLGLLYGKLRAAYDGVSQHPTSPKSFLSSILQAERPDSKNFWVQYLEGAAPALISPRTTVSDGVTDNLERHEQRSKVNLPEAMEFCKIRSISLQSLCQGSWAVLLAHYLRRLDVTFGTVLSGRDFQGADDLMFPTMNTVALRCILHGSPVQFLLYLEENMREIREFQHFPLRRAQLDANVHGGDLFNTLFMLQKSSGTSQLNGFMKSVDGSSAVEYPICVEAEAMDDHLIWRVACTSQYIPENGLEGMMADLDQVFQYLVISNDSEMLLPEGNLLSICGLPPVFLSEDSVDVNGGLNNGHLEPVQPWNATSSAIRDVLEDVSGIPASSISPLDTLYRLGLDSISAIKISSILRKKSINVRPQDLIRAASIHSMAEAAEMRSQNGNHAQLETNDWAIPYDINIDQLLFDNGIAKESIQEVLPALPMQVYMLSAWQNAEGAVFYPDFYHVVGGIELESIETAWRNLTALSPLLRTLFIATGSREVPFLQVITKDSLSPQITCETNGEYRGTHPLVSIHVTRHGIQTWGVRLKIHHALYDGVTLPALLGLFSSLLGSDNTKINAAEVSPEWKRFTISPVTEAKKNLRRNFWRNYLGDVVPASELNGGTNGMAPVTQRVSYLKRSAVLDAIHIRKKAAQHGISVQSLFLAAYAKALASARHETKHGTVIFGIYLANRSADHEIPAEYPTLNLVPLRVTTSEYRTTIEMAVAIQSDIHAIGIEGRADVGLWEIAAWTGVKIDTFVNFLSLPSEPESVGEGNSVKLVPVEAPNDAIIDSEPKCLSTPSWLEDNVVKDDFPVCSLWFYHRAPRLSITCFPFVSCPCANKRTSNRWRWI